MLALLQILAILSLRYDVANAQEVGRLHLRHWEKLKGIQFNLRRSFIIIAMLLGTKSVLARLAWHFLSCTDLVSPAEDQIC